MVDQNSQFYAILTKVGAAKQANADALGIPWTITQMAVGDGNPGNVDNPALPLPAETATALLNEWRRAPLNQLKVDPTNSSIIVAEQVIPADVGGRWIREIGLYDSDGDLVAVANCAPTFKPLLSQGSGRTQVVRLNLIVSSSSNVQLKIDPSVVLATREYIDSLTVRASQAEAEAGTESSKIMTPLRVFQAIAKVVVQATETVFGWAKVATQAQVTTGADDKTIVTPKKLRAAQATQAEAEAGTDDTKVMTPLRVFQAIAKVVAQATEAAFGWAKIATQAQVNAGTDDSTVVTPKKMRNGFSVLLEATGYIALPSWLGGWILQWVNGGSMSSIASGGSSAKTLTWPLAWPTGPLVPWVTCTGATSTEVGMVATSSGMTASNIVASVYNSTSAAKSVQSVIAFCIGR